MPPFHNILTFFLFHRQLLNSMGGGQVSTMTNELRPNAAGPSAPVYSYPAATVDADAFGRTRTQQYQQLPYDNSYSAPQARIEEIPSGSSSSVSYLLAFVFCDSGPR